MNRLVLLSAITVATAALTTTATPTAAQTLLSAEEAKMSCRKMAGRMQVRILELRGSKRPASQSGLAQGLQQAVTPIFGGSKRGADAVADIDRDLAKLREMNASLKSRKCPYFDLEAELAKDSSAPTPRLIRAGKAKH